MEELGVDREAGVPFSVRMAKALADPLRIKILVELSKRDMSPTQFFQRFGGGSVSRVDRHFKVLLRYGWLIKVEEKKGGKRRGGVEHFYRASRPVMFDNSSWAELPEPMQNSLTCQAFLTFMERVWSAMAAGTIDARDDRHVSWIPVAVDQLGWDNILTRVDALFEFIFEEQERAKPRLAASGETPIPMTIALAAFESPEEDGPKAP